MGEKDEGIKKYHLVVTEQSQDVKYSTGKIANNIAITMDATRWVLDVSGRPLPKLCMPEIVYYCTPTGTLKLNVG